jgi:hypothetical protein
MKNLQVKAAVVGFGEINSPQQLIEDMCLQARKEIESMGIGIVTTPHVTDDVNGVDVKRAVANLRKDDFDLLILCIAGWIPSHTVISITSEFKDKPMILWGLAGKQI